jgi:hypothetical protein
MTALCLPRHALRGDTSVVLAGRVWSPAWTASTLPPGGSPSRLNPSGGAPLRFSSLRAGLDVDPGVWAVAGGSSPVGVTAPPGRPGLGIA